MRNDTKRLLLFVFGCLVVRALYAYSAYSYPQYLRELSYPAFIMGIGFLYIWWFNLRKVGGETFGEKIWWNHLRPIHGLLYLTFAILAWRRDRRAYIPLVLDVIIGALAFVQNRLI